jgi:hypothetical protein
VVLLLQMMRLEVREKSRDFASARHLSGKHTRLTSSQKCLTAECFLKSSIGLKIQENRLSSDDRQSVVALCTLHSAKCDTPIC